MGIREQMPDSFLDALQQEFGFDPPRAHGLDSVNSIKAMLEGRIKVFLALAGNFVRAAPDSAVTEEAMRQCRLTAHISTKLNRSHTVCGRTALILPTPGRTERDVQPYGEQFVTVENSMSEVHTSKGRLKPASKLLLGEIAILCRLAHHTLNGKGDIPWKQFETDYGTIRHRISHIVPGLHDLNRRVVRPGGIRLPNPVNEGVFATATGKAMFTCNAWEMPHAPDGHLLLQTLRSHDQWNTIPYTDSDRYRGIHGSRRVVLVNPADITELGLYEGQPADLVSVWSDDVERRAEGFQVVLYPTSLGCAAAYYPETQVLVPLNSVAETSNQPTSKGIVVRLEPSGTRPGPEAVSQVTG